MTLSPDVVDALPYVEGVLNYLAPIAERPMNWATIHPPVRRVPPACPSRIA